MKNKPYICTQIIKKKQLLNTMSMKNFKRFLPLSLLVLGASVAFGQSSKESKDYKPFPHIFIGVQGGGQTTLTDYSQSKLITPTASVYVGGWFTSAVGARLHVNGLWNKGGFDNGTTDFKYKYRYITTDLDLMLNPLAIFGKKDYYPVNLYVLGGIGLNYAWNNDDAYAQKAYMPMVWKDNRLSRNARVGLMLDVNLCKHLSVNLEVTANSLSDNYNSKINGKDDWSLTAQAGLTYKFGFRKKDPEVPATAALAATTQSLSLYGQMQNTVNERMKNWAKRLDGESKADFLARTSEEAMQAQRLEFTKQVSTEMADNRANKTRSSFKYNTAAQQLGVDFADMPSIALSVPKSDVKEINKSGLQFTNTVYGLNPDDSFEVLYTEALNPVTGKTYTFVKQRQAQSVGSANYVPLSAVLEDMENSQRLQAVATNAVQEAKDKNILSDNTNIYVKTQMIPASNGKTDYKVSYTYTVKDNFSVQDDFAPGKYEAEKSAASTAMLKIINQTISEDFAKYIKDGKTVDINFKGSADASPIHGKIAYNNQYGPINNCKVKVNGTNQNMTVTKATGITSNEQLSLVRAISVKNYILKNTPAFKNVKVNDTYEVEVSADEGSQFRRVAVDFLFHDAF